MFLRIKKLVNVDSLTMNTIQNVTGIIFVILLLLFLYDPEMGEFPT